MRQSSSTGKSPHAVQAPTFSLLPSILRKSTQCETWCDVRRTWTLFWETVCTFDFVYLHFVINVQTFSWLYRRLFCCLIILSKTKKNVATGNHQVTSILSEIPDLWRHGWEHKKWINTPSRFYVWLHVVVETSCNLIRCLIWVQMRESKVGQKE